MPFFNRARKQGQVQTSEPGTEADRPCSTSLCGKPFSGGLLDYIYWGISCSKSQSVKSVEAISACVRPTCMMLVKDVSEDFSHWLWCAPEVALASLSRVSLPADAKHDTAVLASESRKAERHNSVPYSQTLSFLGNWLGLQGSRHGCRYAHQRARARRRRRRRSSKQQRHRQQRRQ